MTLRRLALTTAMALSALGAFATGSAAAAPIWNLDIHHNETHFPPGGKAEYWFDVNNVGDSASTGPITLTVFLPGGMTRDSVRLEFSAQKLEWTCPGSKGDAVFVCTTKGSIPRHTLDRSLVLSVDVHPAAEGERFVSASVSGGGAAKSVSAAERTLISPEPAGFGIVADSFAPDFFTFDGTTPEREASSHPDLLTVPFDFNSVSAPTDNGLGGGKPYQKAEAESIRNVTVDLPPGFVGVPTAVEECSAAAFNVEKCPPSTQIGRIDATTYPLTEAKGFEQITVPVFNLAHPRGTIADLAFVVVNNPVHIRASLDPENNYAIRSTVSDINETLPPFHQQLTVWGVPADPSHDSERCTGFVGDTNEECSTDAERKPFLTLPAQCDADNVFRVHHYDSWQNRGVFGPEIDYSLPDPKTGLPQKMTGCDRPRFEPDVEIEPTGKQANTPTGLDVRIKIAQNENPNALATPPVKRATVTLPEGMSFSPSFADGLQSCSLAQIKLGTNEPISCPDSSRVGEVELHTPLLPKSAEGSMYLAAQGDNPFGSLFALYLVIEDTEERGALIKVPGRIDVDPVTGQITTVFDELPQFPFDDMTLKFRSGPRAPLVSPPSCGTQTIGIEIASYAQPQDPVDASNTYQVTEGPNGTPCPASTAGRPFAPAFAAGTLNPIAGAYSPFLFRLSRDDSEQELARVNTTLPPGLVAKIAGIPFCPEAAIASISTELGRGASELANPACPLASQIGTISAGLGAGPGPNYFPGKVYLAGPYKEAPLSLAVVAPGLAGPFDLGNVVVRAALFVDPENAQVRAVSDPFPTILHGVILRTRDVRLRVDREDTALNPTNCSRMSVDGEIVGLGGAVFNASSPFQVSSCESLAFRPKLAFRLFGGTRRGAHPKLRATLTMPKGGANIASASVALPHSEFLDQNHIDTVCTRVQFSQDVCPAGAIYGTAVAKTPLLDEPLTGPVYLRSSDNPLPDMVAALKGKVDFNVVGRIDSVNGGIRNTFDLVPDAPVESFTLTLQGGKKGLLVHSRNVCKGISRATAKFNAQNGDRVTLRPKLQSACRK